jgi:hypothetical protein
MPNYQDQLLGEYDASGGKDYILPRDYLGVTIDLYEEQLVGGVDYAMIAMGTDTPGGMRDPALIIFDENLNIVKTQYDDNLFGLYSDPNPLISSFRLPNLGVGQIGTFYVGVFDQAGLEGYSSGNSYNLAISHSGIPRSFAGSVDSHMSYLG